MLRSQYYETGIHEISMSTSPRHYPEALSSCKLRPNQRRSVSYKRWQWAASKQDSKIYKDSPNPDIQGHTFEYVGDDSYWPCDTCKFTLQSDVRGIPCMHIHVMINKHIPVLLQQVWFRIGILIDKHCTNYMTCTLFWSARNPSPNSRGFRTQLSMDLRWFRQHTRWISF